MEEPIKIGVRFRDGRLMRGYTQDFNANKPSFHLRKELAGGSGDQPIDLKVEDLKAVFFVKTFEGDRNYPERKIFMEGDKPQGHKMEVTFLDGEVMVGSTMVQDPKRPGFFFFPADPRSNNLRVFVVSKAVKSFRYL